MYRFRDQEIQALKNLSDLQISLTRDRNVVQISPGRSEEASNVSRETIIHLKTWDGSFHNQAFPCRIFLREKIKGTGVDLRITTWGCAEMLQIDNIIAANSMSRTD